MYYECLDFIHNKSGSIFIYVEMDLQYKQMQNLCYTNESVVLLHGRIALATVEYMQNQWNSLWLNMKVKEMKPQKKIICVHIWVYTVHTWKCGCFIFVCQFRIFGFQETYSLFMSLCLTTIHSRSHPFKLQLSKQFHYLSYGIICSGIFELSHVYLRPLKKFFHCVGATFSLNLAYIFANSFRVRQNISLFSHYKLLLSIGSNNHSFFFFFAIQTWPSILYLFYLNAQTKHIFVFIFFELNSTVRYNDSGSANIYIRNEVVSVYIEIL